MSHWVTAYKAANSLEAHTLKGALEVSGIAVQLQGEALAGALGELPANAIEITMQVKNHRLAQARQILQRYQDVAEASWICSRCGEENAGSFELCWQCGQDAPADPLER